MLRRLRGREADQDIRLGRDYFLGATVDFTDEDLAALIRIVGALLVGTLR